MDYDIKYKWLTIFIIQFCTIGVPYILIRIISRLIKKVKHILKDM